MKVFISWSGESSKALAEVLRGWLPSVLQAVKPYFSPDDITKGTRWSNEIGKELEDCKAGLLCLTKDNIEAPWIMFEAGALSKSLSSARVCPILFGLEPSDIKGPLVQFQGAPFTKDEMKKVVKMMNQELGPAALTTEVLDSVFEMWWPKLEERVKKVLSTVQPATAKQKVRSERDILEEVLARVRAVPGVSRGNEIAPGAIRDLLMGYRKLQMEIRRGLPPEMRMRLMESLDRINGPLEYIACHTDPDMRMEMRHLFDLSPDELVLPEPPSLPLTPTEEGKEKPNKRAHRTR